jgi:hypothetical protein
MFRLRHATDPSEGAAAQDVLAARLVVLPATSHAGIWASSDVLVPMIDAFLDDAPPVVPSLF